MTDNRYCADLPVIRNPADALDDFIDTGCIRGITNGNNAETWFKRRDNRNISSAPGSPVAPVPGRISTTWFPDPETMRLHKRPPIARRCGACVSRKWLNRADVSSISDILHVQRKKKPYAPCFRVLGSIS